MWRDRLSLLFALMKGDKSSSSANVYSETEYRDLVHGELKRSERSDHPRRILLIYCTNAQRFILPFGAEVAGKMISVLSMSIRDTDYIGWYRQGHIVGILLTALRPPSAADGCESLKTRLMDRLREILPFTEDYALHIRVFDQGELAAFNESDLPSQFPGSKE